MAKWCDYSPEQKEKARAYSRRYHTETPEQRDARREAKKVKRFLQVSATATAMELKQAETLIRQERRRRFFAKVKLRNRAEQESSAQIAEVFK